jgi:type IV secretion system protein VirB10
MSAQFPPDPGAPRPKAVLPGLDTRAPRPPVVRLRRGVVVGLTLAGAGLVGGALAWAFVVQPDLRAHAHATPPDAATDGAGDVRPSDEVAQAPATYGRLPAPRGLGKVAAAKPVHATPPSTVVGRTHASVETSQAARVSTLFFAVGRSERVSTPASSRGDDAGGVRADYAALYNPHELVAPLSPDEVKAGTILPAVLLTAIDTSRPGPVIAAVNQNIFDTVTGRRLLIPQGARLIGGHEGESGYGDRRAVIVWTRLILPNGKSLLLSKEAGADAQGAVGVEGEVDRRLVPLAVATLFSGAITALGEAARSRDSRSGGLIGDAGDAASLEAAQIGGKLIDRELAVHPVIRLRPGARVGVLITRDLILEPFRP